MKYNPLSQRGMTLIELVLATLIGAIILAAINGLVKLGLDAQTAGRSANELVYQGRFALERITDKARAIAPKTLTTLVADTSGDWFAPAGCIGAACVMYCRNAANQLLIETTTADTACSGTTVLAGNVTAFSAKLPVAMGTVRPVAMLNLTLSNAGSTVTLSSSVRLGGGTQ
jgi:prepilin-type N-terminal cleavage/methylation domain-containing protein